MFYFCTSEDSFVSSDRHTNNCRSAGELGLQCIANCLVAATCMHTTMHRGFVFLSRLFSAGKLVIPSTAGVEKEERSTSFPAEKLTHFSAECSKSAEIETKDKQRRLSWQKKNTLRLKFTTFLDWMLPKFYRTQRSFLQLKERHSRRTSFCAAIWFLPLSLQAQNKGTSKEPRTREHFQVLTMICVEKFKSKESWPFWQTQRMFSLNSVEFSRKTFISSWKKCKRKESSPFWQAQWIFSPPCPRVAM